MVFKATGNNWEACIQTFVQPIPLSIKYTADGFILTQPTRHGAIESAAQLILSNGQDHFYYNVHIINKEFSAIQNRDYRSPKTLNPDYGLVQQRLKHSIDQWRNLIFLPNKLEYFFEDELKLAPKAGVYRIKADESLSAYYVQPGSCTAISISYKFNKDDNNYTVIAGPLYDAYNNMVANGTLVAFVYTANFKTHRMETSLINGVATSFIPYQNNDIQLHAEINNTVSNTITLSH